MDGTFEDESNGYMCNISNDANCDGTLRKTFSNSMTKGTNEEGNGEEEQDQGDNENGRRNSYILSKGSFSLLSKVQNVSLWMMLGCLLQVAM